MSRLSALIDDLCPNGVEFKTLGEIGLIFGGLTGKSKADFSNGNARFVSYVNVYNNPAVNVTAPDYVHITPTEHQRRLQRGDILFTGSSETPKEVAMSSVVTTEVDEPLYLNSFCIGFRLNDPNMLDPEFAKHLFRSSELRKLLGRTASGVTRFNVSKVRLATVKIPVPPRAVQQEIARVLNALGGSGSSLSAELAGELKARRRQYAHYRESLFSPPGANNMSWCQLSEIGQFIRGRRFTKQDVVPDGIASIHYGEIYTGYGVFADAPLSRVRPEMVSSLRFAHTGDLVIAGVGETVEDVGKAVAWLSDEDVAIHDDCFAFHHALNPKFVAYYFQTARFHSQKTKYVARAKMKRISAESLGKILMPVPEREEQDRVVEILDKFNALVSNSSGGLGAEISARRRQYEYYRDKLLSFEVIPA